jgi:hypothetical protein
VLTVGQTFVQVMPYGTNVGLTPGKRVPATPHQRGKIAI